MSYFGLIPEPELLREIARYGSSCLFRVELITPRDASPIIRITLSDGVVEILYSRFNYDQIGIILQWIDTGAEGVYYMALDSVHVSYPPPPGYKWLMRGKWIQLEDLNDHPIVLLPWCYELREVLFAAVALGYAE